MKATLILAAAALLAATQARAQDTQPAAEPTCAEQGKQLIAVMVPLGRTEDEVRALADSGALAPRGTAIAILPLGSYTELKHEQAFRSRMRRMLGRFVDQNTEVAGTVSILLYLDESGKVTEVHPNTGDPRLDRELTNVWKDAAFEPYVIGGCRVRAYIHVPLSFSSENDFLGNRIHVKPVQP
jgi:hypothetical protein